MTEIKAKRVGGPFELQNAGDFCVVRDAILQLGGAADQQAGSSEDPLSLSFRCPCGCGSGSSIAVTGLGARWTWDGNVEKPTVKPSIALFRGGQEHWHGFLTAGVWRPIGGGGGRVPA